MAKTTKTPKTRKPKTRPMPWLTEEDYVPEHHTAGDTRKYQANGPIEWSDVFLAIAKQLSEIDGGNAKEGRGIRACLAYAVRHKDLVIDAVKGSAGLVRAVDFVEEGHSVDLKAKVPAGGRAKLDAMIAKAKAAKAKAAAEAAKAKAAKKKAAK